MTIRTLNLEPPAELVYLSSHQIADSAELDVTQILRAARAGLLHADARMGGRRNRMLFLEARLPELLQTLTRIKTAVSR